MEIAIAIIVCIILLCIIPSIGTRRPHGHQPRMQRVVDPVPPSTSLPISPYTGQPYDPAWGTLIKANPLLNRPQNPDLDITVKRH